MPFPTRYIIQPTEKHNITAILLAGRGNTPEEFADEIQETFNVPSCKWVILGACEPATVFGDAPEWFDLTSTSSPHNEAERQIEG